MEHQLENLRKLVNSFNKNLDEYTSTRYDEDNTRNDFIDKFFKLLGWDVNNDQNLPEDFRDVIRQDKVYIEGHSKSPDYAFKFGKQRYFFVEAKKPAVIIKNSQESAFQLRRYAHSAKLDLSILTNFKEFAVYDSRILPNQKDNPALSRIFYCTLDEYEKNWDFINGTFSKKAIMNDSLKKFSTENKALKGSQPLDKGILQMIEVWRYSLAENIALKNEIDKISNLNDAVQKIIDRIVFLRIAEDRNTEIAGSLKKISTEKNIYELLVKYFTVSNKKYNSGLFAVTNRLDDLNIDDKVLKTIIDDLYYPNPYEFAVLPIEILGQIYEQFLGKKITFKRKTKYGHSIEVEEKPEVRKAHGVYYTPQYIVDYIVENTVGKKIEKQTPKQIEKLTILDPACGSGSFLVGAYKFLLSYHLLYYTDKKRHNQSQKDGKIYLAKKDSYRLTVREKRKILLNNIFGVDIDPQAVEVTKLSLLLALMEGEIVESRKELFFKSSKEALLPDLSNNIKCGNSLIGTDFYKDKNLELFNDEVIETINCFDWNMQFKDIMKSGGFDCVIGNPPWGSKEVIKKDYLPYLQRIYCRNIHNLNIFALFIDKSLEILTENAILGFLIPKNFSKTEAYKDYRLDILKNFNLSLISDFGKFPGVAQESIGVFIKKNRPNSLIKRAVFKNLDIIELEDLSIQAVLKDKFCVITLSELNGLSKICKKVENNSFLLIKEFEIIRGLEHGRKGNLIKCPNCNYFFEKPGKINISKSNMLCKHCLEEINLLNHDSNYQFIYKKKLNRNYKPLLIGNSIDRYQLKKIQYYIEIGLKGINYKDIQKIDEKLLFIRISKDLRGYYDNEKLYCLNALNIVYSKKNMYNLKYLLGILNSKLYKKYIDYRVTSGANLTVRLSNSIMRDIPCRKINFNITIEKAQHDRMVNLVEQMLDAQKKYHESPTPTQKQRIDILDKQIDALVYELYGLTVEEIKIVEGEDSKP